MNNLSRFRLVRNGSLLQIFDNLSGQCLDVQCYSSRKAKEEEHYYRMGGDNLIHEMVIKGVPVFKMIDDEVLGLKKHI